jgi:citrate lyase gamma subunit
MANIVNGDESYPIDIAVGTDGKDFISKGYPDFEWDKDQQHVNKVRTRIDELGIVALLVSPQPNHVGGLKCASVTVADDGYTFLVDGGSVTPVFSVATDGKGAVFIVSDSEVHDEFGRKVHSLADVRSFVTKYNLTDVTIKVADDAAVSLADLAALLNEGFGKTFRLQPIDDGVSIVLDAGDVNVEFGNYFLNVPGRLYIDHVGLTGNAFDVALQASATGEVFLRDSSVGGLVSNGGRIVASGATVIKPEHGVETLAKPVVARGGAIIIRSTAEPAIYGASAQFVFSAISGTIDVADGLHVLADPDHLSWARNGGTFTSYSSEGGATVQVTPGNGSYAAVSLQRLKIVSKDCDTDTECVAECAVGKVVVSGGCASANGLPAINFGPRDIGSFGCTFPLGVMSAKATAACQ